jgi:hypothetical protein
VSSRLWSATSDQRLANRVTAVGQSTPDDERRKRAALDRAATGTIGNVVELLRRAQLTGDTYKLDRLPADSIANVIAEPASLERV